MTVYILYSEICIYNSQSIDNDQEVSVQHRESHPDDPESGSQKNKKNGRNPGN
jgi:hypothetical protein